MNVHWHDRKLAKRLVSGDQRAFDRFFDDYFPRLYRFVAPRLRGNEAAIEDVVQQSLTKALRHIDRYRGEAELFTWLCAIARRELSDWLGRNQRHAEAVVLIEDRADVRAAVESISVTAELGPDAQTLRAEGLRLIQAALDRLPDRYADALEWKYIEGHSVAEIATRLGLGREAAQSLLARARRAFATTYEELMRPLHSHRNGLSS